MGQADTYERNRSWLVWAAAAATLLAACGSGPAPVAAGGKSDAVAGDTAADALASADGDASGDSEPADTGAAAETSGDAQADAESDSTTQGDLGLECPNGCKDFATGSPCLIAVCEAGKCTGQPAEAATACEDGNPCTTGDTCCLPGSQFCTAGTCKSGKNTCECQGKQPDECEAAKGDKNACNGVLVCDTAHFPYQCALDPASVVQCPAAADPCSPTVCQPATGVCAAKPLTDGTPCNSNEACAQSECQAGVCTVTTKLCECLESADCAGKVQANKCAGPWYCDKSEAGKYKCKLNAAQAVYCKPYGDTPCQKNVCDPATGTCTMTPTEWLTCDGGQCTPKKPGEQANQPALCNDGNLCTASDQCQGGKCSAGTGLCACSKNSDCAAKEDGDPCNGTLFCNKVLGACQVNPATVVSCPVLDHPCQSSTCKVVDGKAMCVVGPANQGLPCSDGALCTGGDHCQDGDCVAEANTCVCTSDADCQKFDDGDACNGKLICDTSSGKPACVVNPATVPNCPAGGQACAPTDCDPASGACKSTPKPDGSPCDADGTPCTNGDSCAGGACKPGPAVCGCTNHADCLAFEDGNLCNGTLYCDILSKTCVVNPATVVQCSTAGDGPCVQAQCQPGSGACVAVPIHQGQACDADGSPCTPGDVCDGGTCVAGPNLCGCVSNSQCAAKDDGNLCNGNLYCNTASLLAHCETNPATVVSCPAPGNPCQAAVCDPATGKCSSVPLADDMPCSDGKPCTAGDHCSAGTCVAGPDVCACKTDADCPDDGNPCNGAAVCQGGQCKADPVVCPGDAKGCTVSVCNPATGACQPGPGNCDDGNPCTLDVCEVASGTCQHQALADASPCGGQMVCAAGTCTALPADTAVVSGSFWMGCNAATDANCEADEKPQHLTSVSPVALGRFEVTVAQWQQCVAAGKCAAAGTGAGCTSALPLPWGLPVTCVTAAQAEEYCSWWGGRLPTEAEWELLARGPCTNATCKTTAPRFTWGDVPAPSCNVTWMQGSLKAGCNTEAPLAVGARPLDKSAYGAFDLGGNVAEWLADGYSAGFYADGASGKPNPWAPSASERAVRGGSGTSNPVQVRAGDRKSAKADAASPWIGLRCAKPLAGQP
ncbi:MAG: formylglycine-generating enzyme family protein [Deltaproteobacteria bacterium]|nr:formylglycine-generating enzyme family protein [Deltaproteobacteria bacterium]